MCKLYTVLVLASLWSLFILGTSLLYSMTVLMGHQDFNKMDSKVHIRVGFNKSKAFCYNTSVDLILLRGNEDRITWNWGGFIYTKSEIMEDIKHT